MMSTSDIDLFRCNARGTITRLFEHFPMPTELDVALLVDERAMSTAEQRERHIELVEV